ncbi:MAG: AbrB/MazE/SpoVT family DNA-binding domain-containing protein [Candidatus Bipolaricaulia bacterium]
MARAKISSRGQLVIPKRIREQLHLEPGTEVNIEIADGSIRITPVQDNILEELREMFAPGELGGTQALEEQRHRDLELQKEHEF